MFHYDYSSLIHYSQKVERTQMSCNREMDSGNVIHLHNGVKLSYKKWHHEILGKWMELENVMLGEVTPGAKEHTWDVLTDNWILTKS